MPVQISVSEGNFKTSHTSFTGTNAHRRRWKKKTRQAWSQTPDNFGDWFDDERQCWLESRDALRMFKLTQKQCDYCRQPLTLFKQVKTLFTGTDGKNRKLAEQIIQQWTPVPLEESYDFPENK